MSDGVRAPRQQRSHASTDKMLDAVLAITAREGLAGVTIAAVGRESGVSNGSLYHRFRDRRGLLVQAQERFLSELEQRWLDPDEPVWQLGDSADFLTELVDRFLQIFLQRRLMFRALLLADDTEPLLAARGRLARERTARFITDHLRGRYGVSEEVAAVAYEMVHAQAIMLTVLEVQELRIATSPAARRHLVRGLAAVLGQPDG